MAQVTIVVPIYKVEKYLRGCFDSLLKQTSRDFVIMAVNDGSPDGCWPIICEYAEKYPDMITAVNKENGGYGSVLQYALREMKTPYFLICDPDDTLEPAAVETLLNLAKISGADITIGAKLFMYNDSTLKEYDTAYNTEFTKLESNHVYNRGTEEFDQLFFLDPSPHAKLYRRETASGIVFPEKVSYTDNLLFYISLLNSKKVIYTNIPLANYLIDRPGNTMTDVRYSAMNGQIRVFNTILDQAEKISPLPDMFWYRMFESFKFMLYQTRRLNCSEEEYSEVMTNLGTFLARIVPHGSAVRPYYRRYTKAAAVERLRDEAMLTGALSSTAYKRLAAKMLGEFKEARAAKKD